MFFKKGAILIEVEAKKIKLCYMEKGAKAYFEKIELADGINMEVAVKGYRERHNINPSTASLIVKSPEVKARYCKLERTPLKMVDKAIKSIDWLKLTSSDEKMIEDYKVVDVSDGNVCVLWAAIPEKTVMDCVKALKNLSITVERVDVFHNCIAKNFCSEKDTELLVMFRYFGEAAVIHFKNGIVTGIKDIMFDYDDPPKEKLYNAINSGFSQINMEKVYILSNELSFAKLYFDERGIACKILDKQETEFIGINNLYESHLK